MTTRTRTRTGWLTLCDKCSAPMPPPMLARYYGLAVICPKCKNRAPDLERKT